jgi:hypothetical protein
MTSEYTIEEDKKVVESLISPPLQAYVNFFVQEVKKSQKEFSDKEFNEGRNTAGTIIIDHTFSIGSKDMVIETIQMSKNEEIKSLSSERKITSSFLEKEETIAKLNLSPHDGVVQIYEDNKFFVDKLIHSKKSQTANNFFKLRK